MLTNSTITSKPNDKKKKPDPAKQPGILAAFMPGQQMALAQQLDAGFGGSPEKWQGMLSRVYSPQYNSANFNYAAGGGGHGGNGNPANPSVDPNTPLPYDPSVWGSHGTNNLSPEMIIRLRQMGMR